MEIIEAEDPLKVERVIESKCALSNPKGRPKALSTVKFCAQPKSIVSRMLSEIKKSDDVKKNLCSIEIIPPTECSTTESTLPCLPSTSSEQKVPDDNPHAQKIILKRHHVPDNELTIAEETEIRCKTLRDLKVEKEEPTTSNAGPCIDEVQKTLNETQFHCEHTNCTYSTNLLCNLSKHKRIHTDEKPFLCDQCPFRTNFVNSLKVHRRIHTTERPYCCDQCGYKCNTISNLKKHKHHKHV